MVYLVCVSSDIYSIFTALHFGTFPILGSGLHTFVLFLGPWIAKVTLAASTCTWSGLQFSGTSGVFCLEDLSGLFFSYCSINV